MSDDQHLPDAPAASAPEANMDGSGSDSGKKDVSPVGKRLGRVNPDEDVDMNGNVVEEQETEQHPHEDDTANEGELSPPPSSSSVSSVDPDMLGDEIIVGAHLNGDRKGSPAKAPSEIEQDATEEVEDSEPISAQYPKRKRSSVYANLHEDKLEEPFPKEDEEGTPVSRAALPSPRRHGSAKASHVPIGYWRESQVPDLVGKHIVIGFMDVRDRLRTRVLSHTRSGEPVNGRLYPLPPGPGGSWVTFDRIVFDDHLVGLDHEQIKEYVKIRADTLDQNTSAGEKHRLDMVAVDEAKRRTEGRDLDAAVVPQPLIAYGLEVPAGANGSIRSVEAKRRRTGSAIGTIADHAAVPGNPAAPAAPQQPTPVRTPAPASDTRPMEIREITRPTRILVGCWKKSDAPNERDKLAVFGILGNNDMFRVKLVRETMDGRPSDQNFPAGAGALWVAYEDVQFLDHIRHLSRPEIKEYVRVRQAQLDTGEQSRQREANEAKAVTEAQRRASSHTKPPPVITNIAPRQPAASVEAEDVGDYRRSAAHEPTVPVRGTRPAAHNETRPMRHSLPGYGTRNNSIGHDHAERQRTLVSRQMDRMEAAQARDDRYLMNRAPMAQPEPPKEDRSGAANAQLERMQKVWESQEQNRMRGNEDVKLYMGIKYERKQNGPFVGKLVSQGQIISIDGEDYVEYRVLTKPSFF